MPITDIGFLDQDSLVDMVTMKCGGSNPIYIYESPSQYSNPTNIVWRDSGFENIYGGKIADLDHDGLHEFIFSYSAHITCVYETAGDNQYIPVWIDSIYKSAFFTIGDFDLDGKMDFATGFPASSGGWVQIWECIGNNNYQMVFRDTITNGDNNYDVFSAHDMDFNGKPEILFTSVYFFSGTAHLFCYEMTGDNTYDYFLIDSIPNLPVNISGGGSTCGDIDADGVEEIVWSSINQWHIYKAVGEHQYQRTYSSAWTSHNTTYLEVYDMNGNGYPEVIEAWFENGSPAHHAVVIWEIEGVRLHQPNGWEVLNPGQPFNITWENFDPPGADSFALFFSPDNGRSYDTIATGLSSTDTSHLWTVPNAISDSCEIMIWAYGPPRPGEQVPRGTAWDFSDTLFSIRPAGIQEHQTKCAHLELSINPNPFKNTTMINMIGDTRHLTNYPLIKIYNISGNLIKSFWSSQIEPFDFNSIYWDGYDQSGNIVPAGIYLVQCNTNAGMLTKKIIKIK